MAVTRGTANGATFTSATATMTVNVAIASDDNYIVAYICGAGVSSHASFGVQGVTVAGVAMTRMFTDPGGSGTMGVEVYELFNPTVGASVAVVATRAASGSAAAALIVRSFKGVKSGAKTWTRTNLTSTTSAAQTRSVNITSTSVDDLTESCGAANVSFSAFEATAGFQTIDLTYTDANSNEYRAGIRAGTAGTVVHSWDSDADASGRAAYALSTNLDATPTAASKLIITVDPPASAIVGAVFSVTVEAQSPSGIKDLTYVANVTIAVQTGTGTLGGTTTKAAVAGVATFNNLTMGTLQTGLILRVSSAALTVDDTTPMDIVAGAAGGGGVFQSGIFD